jgi:hypothetical protein
MAKLFKHQQLSVCPSQCMESAEINTFSAPVAQPEINTGQRNGHLLYTPDLRLEKKMAVGFLRVTINVR